MLIHGTNPSDIPRIPFDRDLYGDKLANELDELCRQNPTEEEKDDGFIYNIRRRNRVYSGIQKKKEETTTTDDADPSPFSLLGLSNDKENKGRKNLGACGDFGSVVATYPLHLLLERRVYGPAHSRNEFLREQRLHHHQQQEQHQQQQQYHGDVDGIATTRDRIQFIETLDKELDSTPEALQPNDVVPPSSSSSQTTERHRTLPNNFGPVSKVKNYTEAESSVVIIDDGLSVREQLEDRLVEYDDGIESGYRAKAGHGWASEEGDWRRGERRRKEDVVMRDIGLRRNEALRKFAHLFHDNNEDGTNTNDNNNSNKTGSDNRSTVPSSATDTIITTTRTRPILSQTVARTVVRTLHNITSHTKALLLPRSDGSSSNTNDGAIEILFDAIDDHDVQLVGYALNVNGVTPNSRRGGTTAFLGLFARLCRMDASLRSTIDNNNNNNNNNNDDDDGGDDHGLSFRRVEHEHDNDNRILELLWRCGADVDALDCPNEHRGWGALHYAAAYGSLERLEWLLRCRPKIDLLSSSPTSSSSASSSLDEVSSPFITAVEKTGKQTPLMLCCERGRFRTAYRLIEHQSDPNLRSSDERTVLHYAAKGSNLTLLQFLVECGSARDKLRKCHGGDTPVSIVCRGEEGRDGPVAEYLKTVAMPVEKMTWYMDTLPEVKRLGRKLDTVMEGEVAGKGRRRKKKGRKNGGGKVLRSGCWKLDWPRM